MLEFDGAPRVDRRTQRILEARLGRPINPSSTIDLLTLEPLCYDMLSAPAVAGRSALHIGHRDPTLVPQHIATNVDWRTADSNRMQGDLTLDQSRSMLSAIVARHLGTLD